MAEEEFVDLRPEGEQKKKKSGCLIFLIVMLSLLLVALIVVAIGMNYIFGRLGHFENPEPSDGTIPKMSDEFDVEGNQEGAENFETVDASDVVFETVDVLEGDMINIMLIGQDRRPGEERARSDSMILVTINQEKNTIQLTSFMRDLYVQIPGYLDNRLNVAYRYGDVALMNETFKRNFGLEIDGNVMVDFDEFTSIIDILGGVTLEISEAEAKYMNKHSDNHFEAGLNFLNAKDALTFTRMRYAAGGDYGRTDRQRRVLTALAESVRGSDLMTIWTMVDRILPHIATNLGDMEIIQCLRDGLAILASGGQVETFRIPQDDAHYQASIRGMAVLVPNLKKCQQDLQEFIYSNEG
jgi:LCP family protein required for cell wall assembly